MVHVLFIWFNAVGNFIVLQLMMKMIKLLFENILKIPNGSFQLKLTSEKEFIYKYLMGLMFKLFKPYRKIHTDNNVDLIKVLKYDS